MAKFRKKPVVIEAFQTEPPGFTTQEPPIWLLQAIADGTVSFVIHPEPSWMIRTLEGDMHGSPGDWIIKGVKGELYPCKPDIFAATYDPL